MLARNSARSGDALQARARETKVRVESALRSVGFYDEIKLKTDWIGWERHEDLVLALACLYGSEHMPTDTVFWGELSLGGDVHPMRGVLTRARGLRSDVRRLIVPHSNRLEAAHAVSDAVSVYPVKSLREAMSLMDLPEHQWPVPFAKPAWAAEGYVYSPHWMAAKDQGMNAELEALLGPCGDVLKAGKVLVLQSLRGTYSTSIARRMVEHGFGELTYAEALAQSTNYSDVGLLDEQGIMTRRSFRAPHHSASAKGLESECELAQYGVLFLDGLEDYSQEALRCMRRRLAAQATIGQRASLVLSVSKCLCRGLCTRKCNPKRHQDFLDAVLKDLGFAYEVIQLPS